MSRLEQSVFYRREDQVHAEAVVEYGDRAYHIGIRSRSDSTRDGVCLLGIVVGESQSATRTPRGQVRVRRRGREDEIISVTNLSINRNLGRTLIEVRGVSDLHLADHGLSAQDLSALVNSDTISRIRNYLSNIVASKTGSERRLGLREVWAD